MALGIETKDLRKRLRGNPALRGLSLRFEPGLLHGVIGPDGAGKTTLMRTLVGLLRPDEGQVLYDRDGSLVSFSEVRPVMAYMPQQQSLYPDLSVEEHLEFFRDLYRLSPADYAQRSTELLRITRLERFKDRRAGKLSGGMYKKLGLMCALLQSPALILLDEPTNGVDPISRREFWDLLRGLVERKVTVLLSTAYMDEAGRCSKVHLLDSGSCIASGEPRALIQERGARSIEELFLR
ncbi:MAG: ABC transporter ATP-binding protein [Elusimicrobiota bacterium]